MPRTITGEGVDVKRIGDRVIIQSQDTRPLIQESEVRLFAIIQEYDDILACIDAGQTAPPATYDPDYANQLLNAFVNGDIFYVAKPRWLQKSVYIGANSVFLDGVPVTFKYPNVGERVSVPDITGVTDSNALPYFASSYLEKITPSYFAGDIIRAVRGDSGLVYNNINSTEDIPIIWIDLNDAGRCWQRADNSQTVALSSYAGNGYWNGMLSVRDNKNHSFVSQSGRLIWLIGTVPLNTSSFDGGEVLIGSFVGLETGGPYYLMKDYEVTGIELSDSTKWLPLELTFHPDIPPSDWAAGIYQAGFVVTHGGFTWASLEATASEPGMDNTWLAVVLNDRDGQFDLVTVFTTGDVTREERCTYEVETPRTNIITGTGGVYNFGVTLETITAGTDTAPGVGRVVLYKLSTSKKYVNTGIVVQAYNRCAAIDPGWWVDVPIDSFTGDRIISPECAQAPPNPVIVPCCDLPDTIPLSWVTTHPLFYGMHITGNLVKGTGLDLWQFIANNGDEDPIFANGILYALHIYMSCDPDLGLIVYSNFTWAAGIETLATFSTTTAIDCGAFCYKGIGTLFYGNGTSPQWFDGTDYHDSVEILDIGSSCCDVVILFAEQSITVSSPTFKTYGSGFDTVTLSNNTITLNLGATAHCIAADTNKATWEFDTPPSGAGALTAIVSNGTCDSGLAVQIAEVEGGDCVTAMPSALIFTVTGNFNCPCLTSPASCDLTDGVGNVDVGGCSPYLIPIQLFCINGKWQVSVGALGVNLTVDSTSPFQLSATNAGGASALCHSSDSTIDVLIVEGGGGGGDGSSCAASLVATMGVLYDVASAGMSDTWVKVAKTPSTAYSITIALASGNFPDNIRIFEGDDCGTQSHVDDISAAGCVDESGTAGGFVWLRIGTTNPPYSINITVSSSPC